MTAETIVATARERGIIIWADSGIVRCRSPKGSMTPDLASAIREHKPVVLALLEEEAHVDVDVDQSVEAHVEQSTTEEPVPAQELRERQVDQDVDQHVDVEVEAEVAIRVEAFVDQARHPGPVPGPVPFLAVPGAPDTTDGCVSCGAPLGTPYPPRCPACIAAAHRVLATLAQEPAQDAPGAAPPTRPACCPACGEVGLWRRIAGPDEAFCVRCGTVAEPTGPGPPLPRPRLYHHHHEEVHHDGDHPPRNPAPGVRGRRQRRVFLADR